jgi:hypothetical protein
VTAEQLVSEIRTALYSGFPDIAATMIRSHVSAEVARQTAELRRDSERLDAVDKERFMICAKNGLFQCWNFLGDGTYFASGGTVRAAIDAATNKGEQA